MNIGGKLFRKIAGATFVMSLMLGMFSTEFFYWCGVKKKTDIYQCLISMYGPGRERYLTIETYELYHVIRFSSFTIAALVVLLTLLRKDRKQILYGEYPETYLRKFRP